MPSPRDRSFPRPGRLWLPVWRRNALVWRKLAWTSMLGNLADPLIYVIGLGAGLGALLPEVGGTSYMAFLAAGMVCSSTMNTATFEALYSAFSRMHVQKTWEAILNTPAGLDDILFGELCWAATKSLLSGSAILLVMAALGLVGSPLALAAIPVILLGGLAFAALGLIVNALAPSYDFFMYYFTLVITPMLLVSGVFFPADALPDAVRAVATLLPLAHVVALVRPLLQGALPADAFLHLAALAGTAVAAFWLAAILTRRRLLG